MTFLFVRTILVYLCVILALRIMGKRTIGEMHPTELVVTIMISDLATIPLQERNTPVYEGVVPIFTLMLLELIFSFLILKSKFIRKILVGESCHVVKKGKILYRQLKKQRVTIEDIEAQVRIAGYNSLSEVRDVIIETNGQVSVLPKQKEKGGNKNAGSN